MLLTTWLSTVPDPRRPQGRSYGLEPLLWFSLLAVLSNATSYRKIARLIQARLPCLNALCGLSWKRAPAHPAIRYALHGLNPAELEAAFRRHAATLVAAATRGGLPRVGWQDLARQRGPLCASFCALRKLLVTT